MFLESVTASVIPQTPTIQGLWKLFHSSIEQLVPPSIGSDSNTGPWMLSLGHQRSAENDSPVVTATGLSKTPHIFSPLHPSHQGPGCQLSLQKMPTVCTFIPNSWNHPPREKKQVPRVDEMSFTLNLESRYISDIFRYESCSIAFISIKGTQWVLHPPW